ncbi:D-xylose dehydrogenase (NADP) [Haladaptatus litoreus]|uniref:D-xylose dehydrogenase (NADP) n=1 Tax=Haladaptatus litoreus TaxID=553468 RepID=A0A1N6VTW0_9EURY|nr:D-xylose 1-dehydrogenase Gfo6 [Haladaptatus litoreus]SIQ81301.1 D-xylose dehydrogenase (NADP) [Haladaptatus litoreus]
MQLTDHLAEFTRRDWQTVSDPDERIRFALIGLGWFTTERVIPAIAESDLCEVSTVVSGSSEKADRVGDEAGAEYRLGYDEFHAGEANERYDAVYIATPNATHLDFVESAADFGKAVLCEKPLEATTARAEKVVRTCENAGITLMVGYRMHTNPAVRRMRELVREGFVGDPALVEGAMCQNVFEMISPDPNQWRLDADLAGGSALIDLGIYPLNTARFVLDSNPVSAQGTTKSPHEHFSEVDQHVSFEVEFETGVTAACVASQYAQQRSQFSVIGTEGRLTLEPAFFGEAQLTAERNGAKADFLVEPVNEEVEEFDYFADCLLSGRDPEPDGQHALVDMRTIEAIYESAKIDERIPITA